MMGNLDSVLPEKGVNFLPWIGKRYLGGFLGRRLLVLGESHYNEFNGCKNVLDCNITRDCVIETINRERGARFWPNVEQALLGESRVNHWAPSGGEPLWQRLAFYNFVQSPVDGGPGRSPTSKQFKDAWSPFLCVLEALRPERVWVCGKRHWWHMEDTTEKDDILHRFIQGYPLADGTPVWCLATNHASSPNFSWTDAHCLIKEFLNLPENARDLLQSQESNREGLSGEVV